jgi:hypothetical protein
MENGDALKLKKEIAKLDKKIMTLEFARAGSKRRLEAICIHNDLERRSEYQPGGYLDKSKYIHKIICTVCGKVLQEKVEIGSFE